MWPSCGTEAPTSADAKIKPGKGWGVNGCERLKNISYDEVSESCLS